jgi:transcriptional regulator with XRE-family HTH domain
VSLIAQVVIDLEIRRGTSSLTIVKAQDRDQGILHKPYAYWTRDFSVSFDEANKTTGRLDLGLRLKEFRTRSGLSQTEVARLVGVTPSTISQVENNLIYPSVPALLKIAEVLGVDISSFFDDKSDREKRVVFPSLVDSQSEFSWPVSVFETVVNITEHPGFVLYPIDSHRFDI